MTDQSYSFNVSEADLRTDAFKKFRVNSGDNKPAIINFTGNLEADSS